MKKGMPMRACPFHVAQWIERVPTKSKVTITISHYANGCNT